jgi:hypothetical protein
MSFDYYSVQTELTVNTKKKKVLLATPENKKEMPCDTCKLINKCAAENTECVAARVWYGSGDYSANDVGRLIRKFKEY